MVPGQYESVQSSCCAEPLYLHLTGLRVYFLSNNDLEQRKSGL